MNSMGTKLCVRLGLLEGAAVGLLTNLIKQPPVFLTFAQSVVCGLVVALLMGLISAAIVWLVSRLSIQPVVRLAVFIALLVGLALGPLASGLAHPILSMLICAILGGICGWLVCRILCGQRGATTGLAGPISNKLMEVSE